MPTAPPPTLSGRADNPLTQRRCHAWLVSIPAAGPPDWDAQLRAWLIDGASVSPRWQWCMVGIVHLREIKGAEPRAVRMKGATHELLILAVDPIEPPDVTGVEPTHVLDPPQVSVQLSGLDDGQARRLCDLVVAGILDGIAPPDATFRREWENIIRATAMEITIGRPRSTH